MIGNNPYSAQYQGMPRADMGNMQAPTAGNAWGNMNQRVPTWGHAASSTGGIMPPHMQQQPMSFNMQQPGMQQHSWPPQFMQGNWMPGRY